MSLTLPVVTAAALADSFNPCAISVLLLTIGFLLSLNKSRKQILLIAGVYILGIFLTYIFIGLGILKTLSVFGFPHALSKFGATVIILTGIINLLNIWNPQFPIKLQIPQFSKPGIAKLMQKSTLPALFLMGVVVGLFEFPCTGGPYIFILSLLHDNSTFTTGLMYLIYYNIIFIAPLIFILIGASSPALNKRIATWRKSHLRQAEIVSSSIMLFLGIVIFLL